MTTATAFMAHTTRGASTGAAIPTRRRAVGRPVLDLAPWIAPFAWMTVLALAVAGLGVAAMLRDGVPSATPATITVRVAPSDSLWSIARAYRLPGASTASTVEAITRINGLHGTAISAGTVLHVPALEVADGAFAQADSPLVAR
jgi:LysM repeat protein